MVDFWVDFIFSGNPNILQGQWSPVDKEHRYLNISGLHSFMGNSENLQERMALWEDIMSNKTSLETTTQISTTNPTTRPTNDPTNDPTTSTTDTPVTTNPSTSTDVPTITPTTTPTSETPVTTNRFTSTDVPTITPATTPTTETADSGATKLNCPFIFLIMFLFAITRYVCNNCK